MKRGNRRILRAARAYVAYARRATNCELGPELRAMADAVDALDKPAAHLSPAHYATLTRVEAMLALALDYSMTPDTYERVNGARKLVREMLSDEPAAQGGSK